MQHFGNKTHLISRVTAQEKTTETVKSLTEQQIISQCKKGDRAAQKALYDRLSSRMFPVCLRYMGNREAAEDVLQEGFISLFSKLDSYSGEGSFEGWARKVFVNTALMTLRKNDVMRKSEDIETAWSVSSEDPGALHNISYKELMGLIAGLPPGFRTVFNMFLIEGYSHKEISQALGITEATSRSQLQRARVMLQNKIKNLK